MPDLSLFTTISEILGISLNELMQGERIIGNKNADSIENSLDKVEGLGYFIEIEMYDKNIPIKEANRLLLEFIKEMDLDITKRNLKGYSYLMYDKTKKS